MRITKIWDGADPGGTPGRVFTGSIGQEPIVAGGAFLSHLSIGLKGAVSTAAVAIEDFVDVLSEYDVWVGADLRIKLDGNDLAAVSAYYADTIPTLGENSDGTGNDFMGGIKLPINIPVEASKPISHSATRSAVTNIGTETMSVTAYWLDKAAAKKPLHAVVITLTSAGSTGSDIYNFRVPNIGTLVGLIAAMPAASDFTDANIDTSFERVDLLKDGETRVELNTLGDARTAVETNVVSQSIFADLLGRYKYFDFSDEGFNLKEGVWTITVDNQDASDALRFIPLIEIG